MALLFPFWTLTQVIIVEPLPFTLMEPITTTGPTPTASPVINWWQIAGILYLLGVFFFLGRFGLQLVSLRRLLKRASTTVRNDQFTYMETQEDTSPFSFFHIIVYNPERHPTAELETILAHEKVHALQKHSLDILLIHLFAAFQWINPIVWWYRTTVSQNLEYIADQEVAKSTGNGKDYQYLLLKNSTVSTPHSSIINPIFNSSIKKRIVMLNKNRSHQFKAWKFSLVIPFLALFLVAFNTNTVKQVIPSTSPNNVGKDLTKIVYTIDKATTDETLKNISNALRDYKVELLFKDITRNAEGYITAINSSFSSFAGSGTSTSPYTTEGIKPFAFIMEIDQEGKLNSIGYDMRTHEDPTKSELNGIQMSDFIKIMEVKSSPYGDPLFIVDGVEYSVDTKPTDLDPADVQSISVIKKAEAIKQYGEKGKNGVINVVTIKKSEFKGPNEVLQVLIPKDDHNTASDPKEKMPKTITITGHKALGPNPKPLIILDGTEKEPSFNISSIPADTIESIQIFKDGEATQRFGKKGKNGVIEITTKKD